MFMNFILGMVLIESIAIYGLVIAFLLQGKICSSLRRARLNAGREPAAGLTPFESRGIPMPPPGVRDPADPRSR